MTVIRASEVEIFELPGIIFSSFASPKKGSTENAAWRLRIQPGTPGAPHQLTHQEVIHAISGKATATVGGKATTLQSGDTIIVPPNTDFSLANTGAEPFEAIAIFPASGQTIIGGEAFTPPWAA
jgi:quercetin dioxygenase-like cupin family protein